MVGWWLLGGWLVIGGWLVGRVGGWLIGGWFVGDQMLLRDFGLMGQRVCMSTNSDSPVILDGKFSSFW
jgi:hypothetical protein